MSKKIATNYRTGVSSLLRCPRTWQNPTIDLAMDAKLEYSLSPSEIAMGSSTADGKVISSCQVHLPRSVCQLSTTGTVPIYNLSWISEMG